MHVVFTDLDGTLLDHHSYAFEPARPALELLRQRGVPLIFTTSKTRAEVEMWRERTGNRDPFIVENGGAAFIPRDYFPFPIPGSTAREAYAVIEFGDPYPELVEVLRAASRESGIEARGFSTWSDAEVAEICGMPLDQARLAKRREYDEPFVPAAPDASALVAAIEVRGKLCTRGGRFYHITGKNSKAGAVEALCGLYARQSGDVNSVGLGDGWNDVEFLNVVRTPVVMESPAAGRILPAVPRARRSVLAGPAGWNQTILELFGG